MALTFCVQARVDATVDVVSLAGRSAAVATCRTMLSTVEATLPACTWASAWAVAWGSGSLTPTLPAAPATALCSELGRNPAAARPPVAAVAATTPMMAILAVIDPPKMLPNTSRFFHRGLRPRSSPRT